MTSVQCYSLTFHSRFGIIQELAHSLNAHKKWQLTEICHILMTRQL